MTRNDSSTSLDDDILSDKLQEECGVIGLWGIPESATHAHLGLYALQHRGQEGAGVVSADSSGQFHSHKEKGLVSDVFVDFDFDKLPGAAAIGHVRYTTAGGNTLANVQPFVVNISCGPVAIAHNGNLINADALRQRLISQGAIFNSTSDTEIFLHLFARAPKGSTPAEIVSSALREVEGAFSLVILFRDRLFAVRDRNGLRPLVMGSLNGGVVFASETCAFDLIEATYIREVEPGELIEVSNDTIPIRSHFPFPNTDRTPCIFEHVYFSRPDSVTYGKNVYLTRVKFGEELAREHPVEADVIVPVPDSGIPAAIGFSSQSGIPFQNGLIRNHYVGRTFIEPEQGIRAFGVRLKLNANREVIAGKRIVLVDDSLVRGTTSKKIVRMVREAGAAEVHLRISAPPIMSPCYYGIDTPCKEDLIASSHSLQEIAEIIGVDSLGYLSLEGLLKAEGATKKDFCTACFSGHYPVGTPEDFKETQERLF